MRPPQFSEPSLEKFYVGPISKSAIAFVTGYNTVAASHETNGIYHLAQEKGLKIIDLRNNAKFQKLQLAVQDFLAVRHSKFSDGQIADFRNICSEKISSLDELLSPGDHLSRIRKILETGFSTSGSAALQEATQALEEYNRIQDETLVERFDICNRILEHAAPIIDLLIDPASAAHIQQPFYLANMQKLYDCNIVCYERLMLNLYELGSFLPKASMLSTKLPLRTQLDRQ